MEFSPNGSTLNPDENSRVNNMSISFAVLKFKMFFSCTKRLHTPKGNEDVQRFGKRSPANL